MSNNTFINVLLITFACASSGSANAAALFGWSSEKQSKNDRGDVIETQLPDPFAEFTLLSETLFENDQLTEIPGRLVAIVENDKKEQIIVPYAEFILKDDAIIPELKVSEFNYDTYLIDTKSAASLGLAVASASLSGDYKVEYRFYRGATSRISLRDIDKKKYDDLARRVRQDVSAQKLKLVALRIISTAATLHSSYALLQGAKADTGVTGLGWKMGGTFYASKQMTKNRVKIGVSLVSYAGTFESTSSSGGTTSPEPGVNLLGNMAENIKPESVGIKRGTFDSVLKIQSVE
ncbi:hypothetical protein AB8810_06995 [Xanthomonas sp. NCPPB 3005]|uniref:hypothetical protein n=1 Tax=Xanthomonas sp. NCPPB 3005 TaxID=3240913 RepID=UPI003515FF36